MSIAVYVIDTSYLLELFKVPNYSNTSSITEITDRFKNAIINKSRFFVPLPCIFELGNHIADVRKGSIRKKLADSFYKTIKSCVEENGPWIIIPSASIDRLTQLCKNFSENFVIEKVGLTDTAVIIEANRLKEKYSSFHYKVHIWAKDSSLKAREPDTEENPFMG